jgi:two-component system phosphate regulon sensor histidine kinase PhoR
VNDNRSYNELLKELEDTRFRLEEANDTIDAIRTGNIDGLIVKGEDGHQLYTLRSADQTYRIFIEQMNEGAVTLNQYGVILYSNSKFASFLNLPMEKVIGQPFHSFISTSQKKQWDRIFNIAWEKDIKMEMLIKGNDVSVPALLSLKSLVLKEGTSIGIVITDLLEQKISEELLLKKNIELEKARNIAQHLTLTLENTVLERTHELKHRTEELEINIKEKSIAEAKLRANQERLTRILETMAEGVVIYDKWGNLTFANLMAQKMLGLVQNKEDSYSTPDWQHFKLDGNILPDEESPVALTLSSGLPIYDYEIGIRPPGNEMVYISVNTAPVYDEHRNITSILATYMDVTHRRKVIQEKDEFISVASHELRTPITSLKASLQLLDRIKTEPESELLPILIDQASKSLNKVSVLIDDLLNSTKMTEGQLHLNKTKFNIAQLITDFSQQIIVGGTHNIILEGALHTAVFADADKIDQVIVNLVNNAMKYGGESKDIIVKIEETEGSVKVSVADKGPGIAPEKIPHLFDRYFRVDLNGMQYSGLGLGLYICAQIIKKHNGDIGVESEPGTGSKFWFTLPL